MIEIHIEEGYDDEREHAQLVEALVNEGWEIVSHDKTVMPYDDMENHRLLYSTMLKRETPPVGTRMSLSSLQDFVNTLDERQREIRRRLKILENTLDDDTSPDERAYSLANTLPFVEVFLPLSRIQIIDTAIAEDQEIGR